VQNHNIWLLSGRHRTRRTGAPFRLLQRENPVKIEYASGDLPRAGAVSVKNILKNPGLENAGLAASFNNNGAYGVVHVPPGWSFVYRSNDVLRMIDLPKEGQYPIEIVDRPPQVHPNDDFEGALYLETNSYTGMAGFRQRVPVRANQYYLAGVRLNVFVVANEPAINAVRCKIRIHHRDGVAESDWFYVPADRYGDPLEMLAPLVVAAHNGEIGYEFLAEIIWPLVSVKFYIHELRLMEVGRESGKPMWIAPFRTGRV